MSGFAAQDLSGLIWSTNGGDRGDERSCCRRFGRCDLKSLKSVIWS